MTPEAAAEIEAIAADLARMPLVHRTKPHLPAEIRSDLAFRLRKLARESRSTLAPARR
jgi:hypothetical protein